MRVDTPVQESSVGLRVRPGPCASAVLATAEVLAWRLAEYGPARCEGELARFVQAARRHGADPLLGSVVLDRNAPAVTRQRAFGAMHRQVARQSAEA